MASATRCGSSQSTGSGRPVATAQNVQLRVQTLPRIIKVAVPAPQHSPMFGQLPLWQIVCSLYSSTIALTFAYSLPIGNFTLNQSGLGVRCLLDSAGIIGSSIIVVLSF